MKLTKQYLKQLINEVINEEGYKVHPGRKNILKQMGFGNAVKNIETGYCPFCKNKINIEDFKDELSKKEYFVSGLCQKCQNKV